MKKHTTFGNTYVKIVIGVGKGGSTMKKIGLIAHANKKELMQNFCIAYKRVLGKNDLYATGITGRRIEEVTNLKIHKYLPGSLGGEQQLSAQIEQNDIDMVIFFQDPKGASKQEPDIHNITRLCDIHNIPIASNIATAELLIMGLMNGDLDYR